MLTAVIILVSLFLIGALITFINPNKYYSVLGILLPLALIFLLSFAVFVIIRSSYKPKPVATPEKITNQTYYIDKSNRLYRSQNGTTKLMETNISSKIEYNDFIKSPAIEFKSVKIQDKFDLWIPFKIKYKTKTSISKVILPKSDLTEKLTKVEVKNTLQSDSDDLNLAN